VTTARSGDEALEIVRAGRFDLVLSDVVMPGISGYELCACVKKEIEDPPALVLLTTLADPRDIVRGVECGADNYITKPYSGDHLVTRIEQVLVNHELRRREQPGGPARISFLGETYTINSEPQQILGLLLSSFEELIRTNEELQRSKQRAEAATRVRDDVLATVSHDLKNPVGTIFTSASLLLETELPPDAQRRQIDIIRRTAERMDRLIMDLLDVSRMEAGRFSVEPGPESLRSIIADARELFAAVAAAKSIELASHPLDEDLIVHADRGRLLQVMSNLIGNAIKFTPEGGAVTVSVTREDGEIRLSVADTGVGIAPEHLPRIFDRFWHSGQGGGSGLGLAIAQAIVEAHSGRIWAESSTDGTRFQFTLPLARQAEANAQ
jgi:signal transduction histidine kinase